VRFADSAMKAHCVLPGRMEAEAMSGLQVLGMDQLMAAGQAFEERGVDRVIITLKGGDILKNPYEIEDYFGELLECECRVIAGGWN
jgi:fructose-1-phosphate kinase PfkB-like protein